MGQCLKCNYICQLRSLVDTCFLIPYHSTLRQAIFAPDAVVLMDHFLVLLLHY
jgi:hypothetical protein